MMVIEHLLYNIRDFGLAKRYVKDIRKFEPRIASGDPPDEIVFVSLIRSAPISQCR